MVAETRGHIQHVVTELKRACDSMGLKINVWKMKVLVVKNEQMGSCEKVRVRGEEIQEVDKFNSLGVMISTNGGMWEEVAHLREERFGGQWLICGKRTFYPEK